MMWFGVLLAASVIAVIAVVWIRQARHPSTAGKSDWEARIEDHHTGWGNGASGRR